MKLEKRRKLWRSLDNNKYFIATAIILLSNMYRNFVITENNYEMINSMYKNHYAIIFGAPIIVVSLFLIIEIGNNIAEEKFKLKQIKEIEINKRIFHEYVWLVYKELSNMIFEAMITNLDYELEIDEKWINHFAKNFDESFLKKPIRVASILIEAIIKNPIIRCKVSEASELDFIEEKVFDESEFSIQLAANVATTFLSRYKDYLRISEIDTNQLENLLDLTESSYTIERVIRICCKTV